MAFNKINKGQPDWHIPLNANFDSIANGDLLPNGLLKENMLGGISLLPKDNVWDNSINFGENKNTGNLKPNIPSLGGTNAGALLLLAAGGNKWSQVNLTPQGLLAIYTGEETTTDKSAEVWNGLNFPVESGIWKPTASFISTIYTATYTRVGNLVVINGNVGIKAVTGLPTGNTVIGGLPFVNTPVGYAGVTFDFYAGLLGTIAGIVSPATNGISITQDGNYMPLSKVNVNTQLIFSGILSLK